MKVVLPADFQCTCTPVRPGQVGHGCQQLVILILTLSLHLATRYSAIACCWPSHRGLAEVLRASSLAPGVELISVDKSPNGAGDSSSSAGRLVLVLPAEEEDSPPPLDDFSLFQQIGPTSTCARAWTSLPGELPTSSSAALAVLKSITGAAWDVRRFSGTGSHRREQPQEAGRRQYGAVHDDWRPGQVPRWS